MSKLRVLDLFSGIGGFSLGLERTGGFETVAFCEIEEFPRRVLAKHWPGVPIYDDVRTLTAERLAADGIAVDVICGGFPCQDISVAGKAAGLSGERSGLWREFARLVGELRPEYVLVENVAALLNRGLEAVLGDLAALGYDAEWHCIPASAVGAHHRRDRVWILAHPERVGRKAAGAEGNGDDASLGGGREHPRHLQAASVAGCGPPMANAEVGRSRRRGQGPDAQLVRSVPLVGAEWWSAEPALGRMAHGVPGRVDRLRALGNAVVPQIPELIGRAILAAQDALRAAA